ncbi:MAG TPA: hypothetical protein VF163_00370 [Micromonosporaceae bacterium]
MTATTDVLDSPQAIRAHLDRLLASADFDLPGARFVLCDERSEVRAHFHISHLPADVSEADCAFVTSTFAEGLARESRDRAMVLALIRAGTEAVTVADGRWFRAAHQACRDHPVRLLGVHIVTPRGHREVVLDDAL